MKEIPSIFKRAVSGLVSVAMALSMCMPLTAFASDAEASQIPSAEAQGSTIKIIDHNIHTSLKDFDQRAEGAVQLFNKYQPDSIGLQEVNVTWYTYLKEELANKYACVGVGRENGTNDANSGEATPVFYLKDKYDLVDSGNFWLSETPNTPSKGWDAEYNRICTWAILKNKETGETYAHVNTHFDHVGTTARIKSMRMMVDFLNTLDMPAVCTGDFNVAQDSDVYNLMLGSGFMQDVKNLAAQKINEGGTLTNYGEVDPAGKLPIDFVFVSKDDFKVSTYQVLNEKSNDTYISDHLGIYSEMTLMAPAGTYRAVQGTAELDGKLDDAYSRAQAVAIYKDASGNDISSSCATGVARTIYDENYIYSFVSVKDSTPNVNVTNSTNSNYGVDGMQFFYDFKNADGAGWITDHSGYFILDMSNGYLADGKTEVVRWHRGFSGFKGNPEKMDFRAVKTEAGYDIEIRVALPDTIRARYAAGEDNIQIGVGFQINDDQNDDGTREKYSVSDGSVAYAYDKPDHMANMILAGDPTAGSDSPITEKGYYVAVPGTPTVDGTLDEAYHNAPGIAVNRDGSNYVDKSGAATAVTRVLYDDQYLYVFADVKDSAINSLETVQPTDKYTNYGIDNLQFFCDFANTDTAMDMADTYKYSSNDGVNKHEAGYMMLYHNAKPPFVTYGFETYKGVEEKLQYRTARTKAGYAVELRLAMSDSLKARLAEGEHPKIGIGFQINDDTNDDGIRNNTTFSDSRLSSAWESPVYFQDILLGQVGDQPTLGGEPDEEPAIDSNCLTLAPGNDTTELYVTWYADDDTTSAKVSIAGKTVDATVTPASEGKVSCRAVITGLEPGKTYTYTVSDDNGGSWSEEYTYNCPAEGDFSFGYVGDPQINLNKFDEHNNWGGRSTTEGWQAAVKAMFSADVDFIASVGDNTDTTTGVEEEYTAFFSPEELRSIPYAPTMGNHDRNAMFSYHFSYPNAVEFIGQNPTASTGATAAAEIVGNYYYLYNNALFVVLNDSGYPQSKEQAKVFIDTFDATFQAAIAEFGGQYDWLFVQHHKSTESVASHVADKDIQYYVEAGFEKLMDKYDVDFVMAGHDHVYARSYIMKDGKRAEIQGTEVNNADGTVYFTANTASGLKYYALASASNKNNEYPYLADGSVGMQNYGPNNLPVGVSKWSQVYTPGYTIVNVTDDSVTFNSYCVDDTSKSIDTMTVTKDSVEYPWNSDTDAKIAVISDNHLYDTDALGAAGEAFQTYLASDRKMLVESEKILDAALEQIKNSGAEYLLISGDLTKDGEKVNHELLAEKLTAFEAESGIEVFVINGNHDISNAHAKSFTEAGAERTDTVDTKMFKNIYANFGYDHAVAQDSSSLSYAADLGYDYRLIVMDTCIYNDDANNPEQKTGGKFRDETLAWVRNQIEDARRDGRTPIGMMHHGLVPHTAIQPTFFSEYLVEDYANASETLADAGMSLVFTGHFHSQDASYITTANGNILHDVETGSLVTDPAPIRYVALKGDQVSYISTPIRQVPGLTRDDLSAPNLAENGTFNFSDYSHKYLLTGLESQVPMLLTAVLMQQGYDQTTADKMAQDAANSKPFENAGYNGTLAQFLASCMAYHYTGDEDADTSDTHTLLSRLAAGLTQNENKLYQLLGTAASALVHDTQTPGDKANPLTDNAASFTLTEGKDLPGSNGGSSSGSSSASGYSITVEKSTHGTVTTSPKNASKGDTVTITVKPDAGYELDTVKVLDKNGNKVKVVEKNGKYTFTMPASKVTVEATFVESKTLDNPFADVNEDAYYFDSVLWAVENGVTSGTTATTFAPNTTCTRAQTVTFLWRAMGSPEPVMTDNPFTDVSADAYYYKAVLWAVEQGVTFGTTATTFSPDATVTRAQTVTFLWRAAESPKSSAENPFVDVAADAYYADAVLWAAQQGITSGTSATTFNPSNDCTRAQIVTFLWRAMAE